ncbi:hypothetical protein DL98DRAFT_523403 [Cadophora sp. DSE1049]|nr:hypothetical protein DL98DRAFT_523403 [Cadophora sp. DSE1049]
MVDNPSIYQSNINLPYPPAPSVLPFKFKTPRKEIRASLSATSEVGRKPPASGFLETMSTIEIPRIDDLKTFSSPLKEQLSLLVKETRDGKSVAHERQASDGQHDRSCMEDGGSLGQEACPIAVLARFIPINTYKSMMGQHPTRPVVRSSSTHPAPPATDCGSMLWYLIRDEGCRLVKAFSIVRFAFPNVILETSKFAASFMQPGYQESDNCLMEISFTKEVRYIDYYPDHALQQYWVSPILKEGINKPKERSCAYLLSASVCVCSREERVLNRIFRHRRQKHSDMFEDDEFKNLKRSVLGINTCACPQVQIYTVPAKNYMKRKVV